MSNQQSPLVSVCIPVFNGERYILDCISSVFEQNYTNYELLIVDNCSTDETSAIVEKIEDARLKYIRNEENIGSIRNFNKCIKEAQGEYFLLLPHDDLLLPGCLMEFVSKFDDPKVGFAYSAICVVDEHGVTKYSKVNHVESLLLSSEETIIDVVNYFVPIQLAMARTEILQRLGGFDIQYGLFCDVHLWLSVSFDEWKACYNSKPLSCHRVHAQQGQNAFLNPDMKVLSKHWGKELDREFWVENSYNRLFLKLICFLLSEAIVKGYDVSHIEIVLIKLFIRSHLRSLLLAIFKLNGFILWQELLIIKPLAKQYGLQKVLFYYPLVALQEMKKRFSDKLSSR